MPFKYSLNASTLFPYKLGVEEQLHTAAEAGYDGIELWVRDIVSYQQEGGSLKQLSRYIQNSGLEVVNAIAFFAWADVEEAKREQAFIQAEREMRTLAEIGCGAVAAPPFGEVGEVPLKEIAAHYARLSDLARSIGIEALLEFWGRAPKLSSLSEAVFVAMESGLPNAKLLLDPFHMYTGGSSVDSIRYLSGSSIGIVHVNDYPEQPVRAEIQDRHRVMPGDGIAPSQSLADALHAIDYHGYLSLELFMEDVAGRSASELARIGLDKMKSVYG